MSAAVRAKELGVGKVIVLEKMKRIGGSSVRPRGLFAVNSPLQERHGCYYNPDELYRELMFLLNWDVDAKLVRKWICGTADMVRWLESEGAVFNRLTRVESRSNDLRLVHHMIADERGDICTGRTIVDTLTRRCKELGIDIYTSTPARHLKTDEDGNVVGVLAELSGGSLDNVCGNQQNVMALTRRDGEGRDLVLYENLNFDSEDRVLIARARPPAVVEEMDAHGAWRQADATYADGHVTVPGNWPCCGVRVFRLSDKKDL